MKDIRLDSPLQGELIALQEVNDPVFSGGIMGRGGAVKNPAGRVTAPFDGEITSVFDTKHAIGLLSNDGIELLIHVGLDTVNLKGKYFTAHVQAGDKVKKGDLLLEFDAAGIRHEGYDTTTPVVVANADEFGKITLELQGNKVSSVNESAGENDKSAERMGDNKMESREERVAARIAECVGGMANIRSAEHCATRLRLILHDKSKIDEKAIEAIDGVKGQFFAAAQYQIILGTGFVDKVYDALVHQNTSLAGGSNKEAAYDEMTVAQKISRTFGDVFVPIIPVLVATGLFMGLRGMTLSLGMEFSENFLRMSQILTDTAFAFLPALVLGIFAANMQKFCKKFVPDVVDLIVTPFVTLLVSMLLGLLVVGPIMHTVEAAVFGAVRAFLEMPFGIGGFIVGGVHQVIVVSGVHHVFNALEVQLLAATGRDAFNAIITGAIVAQGGAAVAVAVKTKDVKKRALYISSVIPAFLGITEPAIFGINLRFMKPFLYALVGGAFAGGLASFMHLAGTGMGITVLPGTLLYLDNLLPYLMVNLTGFGIAFGLTFMMFTPEE